MKKIKITTIQNLFAILVFALAISTLRSCKESDIYIDRTEGREFLGAQTVIRSASTLRLSIPLELRKGDVVTDDFYLSVTETSKTDVKVYANINPELVTKYNDLHSTSFEEFPADLVSLSNNGEALIKEGSLKSENLTISIKESAKIEEGKVYLIPLSIKSSEGNIFTSTINNTIYYIVKAMGEKESADKESGIKIISCMEVNDTNPLNNLSFTLKNSGKPVVDIVILFSGNINYDPMKGVYVNNNENITHLLENRHKYLKPLQDKGIKVVLGILGNHDRAGIATLTDNVARKFVQELKSICDAYDLDGIFYDDEYDRPMNPPSPGFVYPPSIEAASRLHYETHKAMPDKLVCTYVYQIPRYLCKVDGVLPGEYLSYAIHDYLEGEDLSGNYPGLPRSGMGLYSQEFYRGYWAEEYQLRYLRENGYGAHMIFSLDPTRDDFDEPWGWDPMSPKTALQRIAKVLFDDELVIGEFYKKDWK